MEHCIGETYSDICHPDIMTKTPSTFPDPEMPKIIPDTVVERPKTNADMTDLENNNIDEVIRQKLRKKDVYKYDIHNIYNLIVGNTNEQL